MARLTLGSNPNLWPGPGDLSDGPDYPPEHDCPECDHLLIGDEVCPECGWDWRDDSTSEVDHDR